jgi:cell division protein FtsB
MQRSVSLKGFVLVLALIVAVFLILHTVLRSGVDERAEKEKELKVRLTRLEEENKDLTTQLNVVDTDDYIRSSAVRNYSFVQKDAIRFEFTNPEALYGYSQEELAILMDEISEGGTN